MIAGRNLALLVGIAVAASSCESPSDLKDAPEYATKLDVQFRADARPGERYPFEVVLDVELHNTSNSNRHVTWGGCGIEAQYYRNGSRVNISPPPPTACDDILHMAGLEPLQRRTLREAVVPDISRTLSPGRYKIIMVFTGEIDDVDVRLAIDAGDVDLQ